MTMTKRKKKLLCILILAAAAAAALVVVGLLPKYEPASQPSVEEPAQSDDPQADQDGTAWMEEIKPIAENLPEMSYEEVQSLLEEQRAQMEAGEEIVPLVPPRNYQMKAPPPSPDQLQPGATTEVEPLVYEKPLLSLTPLPDDWFYYNFNPFDPTVGYYLELTGQVEYHNLEKISVEEALQAEYLYLMWEYEGTMRAYIQLGYPVEYYRILDYEPMTVIGVTQGIYTQANFAIRDGKLQRFLL